MPEEKPIQTPEIDIDRAMGVISYIGILCIIPLLVKKQSKFAQHHARQGLVLFIGEIALIIIAVVPLLGWLLSFLGWIVAVLFSVMGIINALAGKMWEMPVLGKYAKKFKF
ncbi:DUF4870 domain-containing protein [Patescibacteria group bacterium]|nr:DUF4870 domain-containing protein [Patescibacteria group bacterium]MBU4512346.1 DUF4870 domain-containing protein [Patescibacteria group bacterium]MCG2692774.1 DUF4870 domain-containing protein [Candidatus Parcubacteria bacterium]